MFPYPSLNSLQKRSSIASERPFAYKSDFNNSFRNSPNNNNNSNNHSNNNIPQINSNSNLSYNSNNAYDSHHNQMLSPTSTSFEQNINININTNMGNNINSYDNDYHASTNNNAINNSNGNNGNSNSNAYYNQQQTCNFASSYNSRFPLYGLDWSVSRNQPYAKIALGSYREDSSNKLEILYGSKHFMNGDEFYNFNKVYDYSIKYPITRLQWDPSMSLLNTDVERLATTSECLRIYEIGIQENSNPNSPNLINGNSNRNMMLDIANHDQKSLYEKAALTNSKSKNLNQLPPMTSFDWNRFEPIHLITCSIDTTCTVWDLIKETFVAKTQLIAHDSEVFDVKYIYGDTNVFTSCSSDGSVRLFDLRNLEQSTIIFEKSDHDTGDHNLTGNGKSNNNTNNNNTNTNNNNNNMSSRVHNSFDDQGSLVRIANSNYNANQIAVLNSNSNQILVLDLRNVGIPLYKLNNNSASVNSISWHPNKNILLSGSDDCQIMTYDFINQDTLGNGTTNAAATNDQADLNRLPDYAFSSNMEVNYVCWDPDGDWIGLNNGKQFQAVQFQ